MSLHDELKQILEHERISKETKLKVVMEIVASYDDAPRRTTIFPAFKPDGSVNTNAPIKEVVHRNRRTKRKPLTQTDIDTVAREYFHNGNNTKRIGRLLGRTQYAISAIIGKLKSGMLRTAITFDRSYRSRPRRNGTVRISPETRIQTHTSHMG